MSSLPYITATGNIEKALNGIKAAATPEHVSQDFVKTILKIPGGSGDQVTSYLKKIGFAKSDRTPSDIYKNFRNEATSGQAVAKSMKVGYAALYKRNEFMHQLPDDELRGLVIEETGQEADSNVVTMIVSCINALKKFASWDTAVAEVMTPVPTPPPATESQGGSHNFNSGASGMGMNLSYTINLNLPATSDISVFNAIFKSLKENLLKGTNE